MSRVKLILSCAFVLALFAGIALGMLTARIPQTHEARSWMSDELNLSSEQRDQMRAIWQDMMKNRSRDWEARRSLEKQRSEDIVALLTPEQKEKYDQINQDFAKSTQEMQKQREQAFADAQEKTKAILTPEQREKYEQLMQKRRDNPGPGGPGGPRHGMPGTERSK